MLPKYHIVIGAIFTILFYQLSNLTYFQAIVIFLSSFLIDFDHYLNYVVNKKDLSLNNATKYFHRHRDKWIQLSVSERKKYKRPMFIFHGIEFWLILFLLSNYNKIFIFILFGIAIHIILDYIDYYYFKEPFYPKFSQLYLYQTNKKKINFPH